MVEPLFAEWFHSSTELRSTNKNIDRLPGGSPATWATWRRPFSYNIEAWVVWSVFAENFEKILLWRIEILSKIVPEGWQLLELMGLWWKMTSPRIVRTVTLFFTRFDSSRLCECISSTILHCHVTLKKNWEFSHSHLPNIKQNQVLRTIV